jgi:ketosteroid isomerase-like protein
MPAFDSCGFGRCVSVRVYGDAAVATGRTRASGRSHGQDVTVVLRFTDVFVRRGGRWQVVASHACAVAS